MSIFDTLEADASQLNQGWLKVDWKDYFNHFSYPDRYKQAWLARRVIELEKENEVLKKAKKGLTDTLKGLKKDEVEKAKNNKEISEEMASFLNKWIETQKS